MPFVNCDRCSSPVPAPATPIAHSQVAVSITWKQIANVAAVITASAIAVVEVTVDIALLAADAELAEQHLPEEGAEQEEDDRLDPVDAHGFLTLLSFSGGRR